MGGPPAPRRGYRPTTLYDARPFRLTCTTASYATIRTSQHAESPPRERIAAGRGETVAIETRSATPLPSRNASPAARYVLSRSVSPRRTGTATVTPRAVGAYRKLAPRSVWPDTSRKPPDTTTVPCAAR